MSTNKHKKRLRLGNYHFERWTVEQYQQALEDDE